jgi:hypothetical protein
VPQMHHAGAAMHCPAQASRTAHANPCLPHGGPGCSFPQAHAGAPCGGPGPSLLQPLPLGRSRPCPTMPGCRMRQAGPQSSGPTHAAAQIRQKGMHAMRLRLVLRPRALPAICLLPGACSRPSRSPERQTTRAAPACYRMTLTCRTDSCRQPPFLNGPPCSTESSALQSPGRPPHGTEWRGRRKRRQASGGGAGRRA